MGYWWCWSSNGGGRVYVVEMLVVVVEEWSWSSDGGVGVLVVLEKWLRRGGGG